MSDQYKNMDDLFRDKFKDFELDPPDHIWGNIKTQIGDSGKGGNGGNSNKGGIYGISIIFIVAGILTWYLLSSSTDEKATVPPGKISQVEDNDYTSSTRMVSINSSEKDQEEQISSQNAIKSPSNKKEKQKTRFDISEPAKIAEGKTILVIQEKNQTNNINFSNDQPTSDQMEVIENYETLTVLSAGSDAELLAINNVYPDEAESIDETSIDEANIALNTLSSEQKGENVEKETGLEAAPEIRSDYGRKGKWMFGLFFTPEMIFYPDNNDLNNRSYSLDVNAIYKFSGYFLQSGLGVSWASDEGNCEIDYNEYLGSYEDVYNVTYDTIGNELNPIYHTETVKVYDSIDRVSIMPTKNHYTYLQIPLLFGYGNENRRFGWFVKGGPSLSILVHKDLSSNDMSGTEDKILSIENEMPSRINTNWQFVFSGGISYKLSNHLSLTAEPVFRYYLNSTYDRSQLEIKNPYSLGLRVGFLIEL